VDKRIATLCVILYSTKIVRKSFTTFTRSKPFRKTKILQFFCPRFETMRLQLRSAELNDSLIWMVFAFNSSLEWIKTNRNKELSAHGTTLSAERNLHHRLACIAKDIFISIYSACILICLHLFTFYLKTRIIIIQDKYIFLSPSFTLF